MPAGRYLTAARDVLAVTLVEAERARPSRRPRAAAPAARPASVVLVSHIRTARDGRAELAAARADPAGAARLVADAVAVLNVAIRAARAATGDPYLVEVTEADARAIRIGVGAAERLAAGDWEDAFEPGRPKPPRVSRTEAVRVTQEIAAALAGRLRSFEAEELALRALLDLAHGRPTAAAHQARAALAVMHAELGSTAPPPELPADADATELTARHVLETAAAHRARRLEALRG